MSIWQEIQEARALLDTTREEARVYGLAMNAAECRYNTAKDLRVRELLDEGMSITMIKEIIKGEPEVSMALNEFQNFQIEYKNACEAVQILKRDYDFLREQYQREWGQANDY